MFLISLLTRGLATAPCRNDSTGGWPRFGPSGTMQKCRTHQMTRSDRVGIGIIFSNLLAMASILMGEPSAPGPRALILLTF
jgi:hypothetical protein